MKKAKYFIIPAVIVILAAAITVIFVLTKDIPFNVIASKKITGQNFTDRKDFFAINNYKKGLAFIYATDGDEEDEIIATIESSDLKSEALSIKRIGSSIYFWQNGKNNDDCNLYIYNIDTGENKKVDVNIDSDFIITDVFEDNRKNPIIIGDKKSGSAYRGFIYPHKENLVSFTKDGTFFPKGYNFNNKIHIMNKDGVIIYDYTKGNTETINFGENYMYESGLSSLMFTDENILIPVLIGTEDSYYIEILDKNKNSLAKAYVPVDTEACVTSGRISALFSVTEKNKDLETYICHTLRYNYSTNKFENFGERNYSFEKVGKNGKLTWRYDYNKRSFTLYNTVSPIRINEVLDIE